MKITATSEKLSTNSYIAIDTETTGLQARRGCRAFMVTACDHNGSTFCWEFPVDPFSREVTYDGNTVNEIIETFYSYPLWVYHNAVFDTNMLGLISKRLDPFHVRKPFIDTMTQAHQFDNTGPLGLKDLAILHLDLPDHDEKDLDEIVKKSASVAKKLGWAVASLSHPHPHLIGMRKNPHKADFWIPSTLARLHPDHSFVEPRRILLETACRTYAVLDAVRTASLYYLFNKSLDEQQKAQVVYHTPFLPIIRRVQSRGLSLVENGIENHQKSLTQHLDELTTELRQMAEDPSFNPASTQQLTEVLYTKFKAPIVKSNKTGPSTDKESLNELFSESDPESVLHLFVKRLLQFRKIKTALNYLGSYQQLKLNDRLYPSIHPYGTRTTRVSSSDPNLQNVSKQDDPELSAMSEDLGINLRGVFGPGKGLHWYAMDYDQLQLRIFAYAAKANRLIEQFEAGSDFHTYVASTLFNTKTPTTMQRRFAKYINFGIIFGAGEQRIDSMTGTPGSFRMFSKQFPEVPRFIRSCIEQVEKKGYVETMGGYRLHVPYHLAYKGANMVVQGTEGEMVKEAMLKCDTYLLFPFPSRKGKLLMQVHDELLFEFPASQDNRNELQRLARLMESAGAELGMNTPVGIKLHDKTWAVGTELQ